MMGVGVRRKERAFVATGSWQPQRDLFLLKMNFEGPN